MKMFAATMMTLLLASQQKLPNTLQISQIEDPRARNNAVIVIGGQTPVITNTQQLPATQLEQRPQPQISGAPFSVEFRDADLRAVLTELARYHGLNLAMPPDITGTVTMDLTNTTLMQALDAILTPRALTYMIDDGLLRVDRVQMESRTFSFDYITTQRTLSRSTSAASTAGGGAITGGGGGAAGGAAGGAGGGAGGGSSTSISGTEATNLLTDVETGLNALKSAAGKIVFNKMAGIIFATDFPRNLDSLQLFLETIENAVQRQVVIEAKVIEVKLNDQSQAGVNWTAVLGNAFRAQQTLSGGGTFQIGVTHGDFTALLDVLSSRGTVNVLSSPTVSTLNNQPAVIRVGTQDVFFTTQTQINQQTGAIAATIVVPTAINEGIVLDVTPQISDDGIITMNIHPTITERTGQVTSPSGGTVPIVDVRETDTVVRVKEQETVIIAGLISDKTITQVDKVPFLGDIPGIGGLFRRTSKDTRKTDLAILLTPRILDIRSAVDYAKSRIEQQENLKREIRP